MAPDNSLLAQLPPATRARLSVRLERVQLDKGQALLEMGEPTRYAYFPIGGLIALEAGSSDGGSVELTTIGAEGMVGVGIVLHHDTAPHRVAVHVRAPALRMRAEALLDAMRDSAVFHNAMLSYTGDQLREISQAVVCHHSHSVLQRLCLRVLTVADRLAVETVDMTHDGLARALGTSRSAIARAVGELQEGEVVWSRQGRILIRKRPMLESTVCDCYGAWREHRRRAWSVADVSAPRAESVTGA